MSPTLSPTLSAITPGLRDRPRDAGLYLAHEVSPTSALLVKMPPPTLEKQGDNGCPHAKTVDGVGGIRVTSKNQ